VALGKREDVWRKKEVPVSGRTEAYKWLSETSPHHEEGAGGTECERLRRGNERKPGGRLTGEGKPSISLRRRGGGGKGAPRTY